MLQRAYDKLSWKNFELFTVCLWLVWYIRNKMVMDKPDGSECKVASLCYA